MKLQIMTQFSGEDKENLPERIIENGIVISNFHKQPSYEKDGLWFADVTIDAGKIDNRFNSDIKSEISKAIRKFIENDNFLLEIEKIAVVKEDGEMTFFKSGGDTGNLIFKDGGNIDVNVDFLKNLTLSKLPKKMQENIKDIIAISDGNLSKINFDKKEIKQELDAINKDISEKELQNKMQEVVALMEKEIKANYPDAIKKRKSKKDILKSKIKGFETALKFSSGDKKKELETKIKGFKTALKFVS